MMQESKESFLVNRLKSTKYAFTGAMHLIKTEASIKVQFSFTLILICLGFYCKISSTEWIVQMLSCGLVLSIEGLNTAIEKVANFIHPEYHEKIGEIKDVAAGAVWFAAIFALSIGAIIYIPKFI